MIYHVEFAERARRDLDEIYKSKQVAHVQAAAAWFNGLESVFETLACFPNRCPAIPENKHRKRDVRHLFYGSKPHVYRIIFEIKVKRQKVLILTIRHGAREPLAFSSAE